MVGERGETSQPRDLKAEYEGVLTEAGEGIRDLLLPEAKRLEGAFPTIPVITGVIALDRAEIDEVKGKLLEEKEDRYHGSVVGVYLTPEGILSCYLNEVNYRGRGWRKLPSFINPNTDPKLWLEYGDQVVRALNVLENSISEESDGAATGRANVS